MTLDTILISQIDNINVTQISGSTLSGKNKKSDYKNPLSSNEVVDLGKAQEKLNISVRVISDALSEQLLNICRNVREVVVRDKFKGEFRVYIDDYEITNSDDSIQFTIFNLKLTILEDIEEPTQDLNTTVSNDALLLENEIDNIPDPINTPSFITALQDGFADTLVAINQASNFIESSITQAQNYANSVEDFKTSIKSMAYKFEVYKNKIKSLKSELFQVFASPESANKGINSIPVAVIAEASTRSSLDKTFTENSNKIAQAQNLTAASLKLQLIAETDFLNSEEAITAQQETLQRLDTISDSEDVDPEQTINDLIQSIRDNLSKYIRSLDLSQIVEIEVRNKPLLVLSYDLYGTIDRAYEIKELNNLIEDDYVTGTIKVLSS